MENKKTLHDLGFRKKPDKKKRSRRSTGKEPPVQPPTSTTLDGLANRFQNMNRHLPADAPTGISGSGHDDAIEKGDQGFTHYLTGKWKDGYPR